MNKWILTGVLALALVGCRESLEERCSRECKQYTERNCPAQIAENMRIDSLTFDRKTLTLHYHYSVEGKIDDDITMDQLFRGKAQLAVLRQTAEKADSMPVRMALSDLNPDRFAYRSDTLTLVIDAKKVDEAEKLLNDNGFVLLGYTSNPNDGHKLLLDNIRNTTNLKQYKDAGYKFAFTYRSTKNPKKVYFSTVFSEKDYR